MPATKTKRRATGATRKKQPRPNQYRGGSHGKHKPEVDLTTVFSQPYLTIEEAAVVARTTPSRIRKWLRNGVLKKSKLNPDPTGRVVISRKRLDELMESLEVDD